MGHYPFGDPWYNATNDKLVFTTYERDAESGNDYAQARFYRWLLGRFLSLDPLSGSTSDPQSLNRYPYVENNPINFADPTGMDECLTGDYGACSGGDAPPWTYGAFGFSDPINAGPSCLAGCGYTNHYGSSTGGYVLINLVTTYQDYEPDGNVLMDEGGYFTATSFSYGDLLQTSNGAGGGPYRGIKDAIRNIVKKKEDCANLFGGSDRANQLLNNMNIAVVPGPYVLTNPEDATAYGVITASNSGTGGTMADTAFRFAPGQSVGWNGSNYTTYVGSLFQALSPGEQTALLMHEMSHPATGYTSNYANGVVDQANSPYSAQNFYDNCVN